MHVVVRWAAFRRKYGSNDNGRKTNQNWQNRNKLREVVGKNDEQAKLRKTNRQRAWPSYTAKDSPAHYSRALHSERAAPSSAR
jgi:hypothetical protein